MNPTTKIRQHDITDCGTACLASVAAHYHLKLPIARIRQYASTNQKGTNVLGLVEAAQRLGFQAKGVKGSLESLSKIPKPTIAHVNIAKEGKVCIMTYGTNSLSLLVLRYDLCKALLSSKFLH